MANVKSYAWGQTLAEAVAIGADAIVPTPGFIDPPSYKTNEAEVVHGGNVLTPEQFTATWDAEFTSVAVTNGTEADWPPGDTLYVTVAGVPFDAATVEDSFAALEARVTTSEANITALDARVAALEVAGGGAAGTLSAPKHSPAPKHKGKAEHREDEEKAKPKAKAGEAHWDPSDIDEAEEEDEHGRKKSKKHK